jgi:ABC-type multidrug transport system fused ATPase/permease subunit
VQVYLQCGAAALALVGVAGGLCATRAEAGAEARAQSRATATDKFRGGLLLLLFFPSIILFDLGLTHQFSVHSVTKAEAVGAGARALSTLALLVWCRREASRGLRESCWVQLWWLLAVAVRVPAIYGSVVDEAGQRDVRVVPLALTSAEVALCLALLFVYCAPAPRPAREPLLASDEEEGFARTVSTREPSPEATGGMLGFLAFAWFTPLVDLAFQRDQAGGKLEPTDVYPLCEKDAARFQLKRLETEWEVEKRKPEPSLSSAMYRAFRWEVAGTAWIKLMNDGLHFVGPFLINKIMYFVKDQNQSMWIGYTYAVCMVLSSFFQAFLMAHYFQMGYRTGMRIRCSLILMSYRKALNVLPWPTPPPPQQPAEAAPGRRCCAGWCKKKVKPPAGVGGMGQMTNLVSADTDKFTFLMPYFNLIWSAPLQLLICFSMLYAYIGLALFGGVFVMIFFTVMSGNLQNQARKVQKLAMEAKDERLKMEVEMLKIVKVIKFYAWESTIERRVKELRDKELKLQLKYKMWNVGLFLSFSLSPSLVALSTFAFYTLVLGKNLDAPTAFTTLSLVNILTFPLSAMPMMARFFMEAAVSKDRIEAFYRAPEVGPRPAAPQEPGLAVCLKASELTWPDGTELLKDVDVSLEKGKLIVVTGKTGTGKSGLLYALLGELPIDPACGHTSVAGSTGYCAQGAWVRNASLKDNITGGRGSSNINPERYEAVLEACALKPDMEVLPDGDQTMIGDRGINLSGGQKQRVALARAVYADPDVYILDDVISKLDAHVAAHICDNLFSGPLMKGKTVVLVTHSRRALPLASRVIALADKKVMFSGTYDEFRASGMIDQVEEQSEEPKEGGGDGATSTKDKAGAKNGNGKAAAKASPAPQKEPQRAAAQTEQRRAGAVSRHVYIAYMKACGGVVPVGLFLLALAASEGSRNLADAWLTHWTDSGGSPDGIAVYGGCALLTAVAGVTYVVARVLVGQVGSRRLHEACVHAMLRAQMTFFDLTPMGQILNRLAEDTNILDYNLPMTMAANLLWTWRSAAIVVVCMFVGWYLALLIIPMFFLYARLARRYLPATRDLRRLDAAARSPIIGNFSETYSGVSTIRAMQRQDQSLRNCVRLLETQCEAYYLSNTAARWLSLRLQFNGTVLVGAVCILGIFLGRNGGLSSGIVGLAITYALKLTDTLNQVNRESADRETQMVSVERVHQYMTGTAQEAALRAEAGIVPAGWPSSGSMKVQDVYMKYREELPTVLNGVSLDIKGGERIGIVGRTGCGKSSLLMTLMRLVEVQSGSIWLDGLDIKEVGLHDLRERAAIIPQDPAILTGTIRFNLDPFRIKTDEQLWNALAKSQLKERVEGAEGGLDSKVEEGGGNYSMGELQLLCLARALLKKPESGGLLLLDEATSDLDAETDKTLQRVIREDFKCTTITIAHRIETLLDYDRVAVLDKGTVVEYDSPQALLARLGSEFQALAREAGVKDT